MIGGSNKLNRGVPSYNDEKSSFNYLKYGEVKSIEDPLGLGRVKVWIKGTSINGGDDETFAREGVNGLPWCTPLLPKHLQVTPKIGEGVFIFLFSREKENADRLYIGPLISSPIKLDYDDAKTTALAGFTFGPFQAPVNVANIPDLNGVFPDKEDVSIQGRFNTDITQRKNEIILRVGKFDTKTDNNVALENPYGIKFNTQTQGFIQIKNNVKLPTESTTEAKTRYGSVTNIVSNKINLITHNGSPVFNVPKANDAIPTDELENILANAHQLPFGDILLRYLILLKEAFLSHVHNGNGNIATDLSPKTSVADFSSKAAQLEQTMLSKNIRIN